MQKISFYVNAKDNKGSTATITDAIEFIKGENLKTVTLNYRNNFLAPTNEANKLFTDYIEGAKIGVLFGIYLEEKKQLAKLNAALKLKKELSVSDARAHASLTLSLPLDASKPDMAAAIEKYEKWQTLKEKQDNFKKVKFPAVTWSAELKARSLEPKFLRSYSGYMCMDLDHLTLTQMETLTRLFKHDDYIFLYFISPSGNGIKIIFKIQCDATQHTQQFEALETYFKQTYSLPVDPSGKDYTRLCFLCHHAFMYHNPDCLIFPLPALVNTPSNSTEKATVDSLVNQKFDKKEKTVFTNTADELDAIFEFTKTGKYQGVTVGDFQDGKRNIFLFLFASNCCRKGITQMDCETYAATFTTELPEKEIKSTINSAYKKNDSDYGKFARKNNTARTSNTAGNKRADSIPGSSNKDSKQLPARSTESSVHIPSKQGTGNNNTTAGEYTQFWYVTTKIDKETGKEKTQCNLEYKKFISFLKEYGFARYRLNEGYQFIREIDKKIKVVTPDDIRDFIFDWCYTRELWEPYEMLIRGNKSYMGADKFQALRYLPVNIKKDTKDECFLYFANQIVTVTKEGAESKSYKELNQHIWDGQVNKHSFKLDITEYSDLEYFKDFKNWDCEFAKFIYYVAYNPQNEEESGLNQSEIFERFSSFCTSIGFLLHSYKHPAYRKGVFAIDHKVSDKFESNGRTGKSIIPAACSHLKVVSTIPGKQYDPQYQFRYENINIDTQIINYNDMKRTHDVETEFEVIADNYSINKRNTGFLTFKYSESAKVYYSTNHIPKGDGESYKGRMHIIEFSDFFNASHTPFDYFGHSLFDDWDESQWNKFYNFLVWCIRLFLEFGLIPYPNGNFNIRKLNQECPQEFIDWADRTITDYPETTPHHERIYKNLPRNKKLTKLPLYQSWITESKEWNINNTTSNMFTRWTKHYCKTRGLTWISKKPGGVEFYWIITPNVNKDEVMKQQGSLNL